ncbi:MAG: hypothetical protein WCI73_02805 [Phycisphaerae bacterium]
MSQNPDFLPEDYVQRREQHRSAILFIGLFVAVMGGIIAAYWVGEAGPRRALADRDRVSREFEDQAGPLAQIDEMEREQQRMYTKAEMTAVLRERVPRSMLFQKITEMMPKPAMSLLTFELRSRDLPAPITKIDQAKNDQGGPKASEPIRPPAQEVTVALTGYAENDGQVATFIAGLNKLSLVVDVNLIFSEEFKAKDDTLRRFKVEMKLNPNADVVANSTPAAK